ncbi:MAG TPA: zinc-ribbon domain-containing protein [Tepidisphaeraceae bacterium]|jgi:tetratricopeptide (TPR) repeat protein
MVRYLAWVKGTNHRRRGKSGFIILFGSRAIISNDAAEPVRTTCPRCNREVDMQGRSFRNWFTLFFVPMFPISGRKSFTQCPQCGAQFSVSPEQLRRRVSMNDQQLNQQAIALYNSLRASPGNSITLDQLMKLYASMKEFDQAVSAAGEFSQALHNSEQCMATLGRIYMAENKFPEAISWFDAAIGRNAGLGEAHYYKALAHMLTTPPDYAAAVVSARAARGAGYADSDALLKEAESKARGA